MRKPTSIPGFVEDAGEGKMLIGGQVRRYTSNDATSTWTLYDHRWLDTIWFGLRHPKRWFYNVFPKRHPLNRSNSVTLKIR